MKPIQSSLKKWLQENDHFQEKHLKMKQDVLRHPDIQEFLSLHPELTQKEIEKNIIKLYEYTTQSKQCADCQSLNGCKNILEGYSPILHMLNNEIHLAYEKCHQLHAQEKQIEQRNLIESLYMPKEILEATIGHLYNDSDRSEAMHELFHFLKQAESGIPSKGIYFHGSFGVGKTYMLGALANKLKEYGISSMLIYMPEFVREIRDSFKDDSVNEKVNYFKKADVLMLDDIGAETQSAWFRDEVLGSILQYRMMEKLPVFFTSNYNLKQLEQQLAVSTRGGIEKVKSGRIMERIKQVSNEVSMVGINRRV